MERSASRRLMTSFGMAATDDDYGHMRSGPPRLIQATLTETLVGFVTMS